MRVIKGFHRLLSPAKSTAVQEGLIRALIYQPTDRTLSLLGHSISLPYYSLNKHLNTQIPFRQPKEGNKKNWSGTGLVECLSSEHRDSVRIWKPQLVKWC